MGQIVAAMATAHASQLFTRPPEEDPKLLGAGIAATPAFAGKDFDFDRWCVGELENGYSDSFLNLTSQLLDEVGNTEMLPRAPVLGALGEQHMELYSYQPTSHHGHKDVDPLVALGAHPVGALMAIHVLQSEQRRMLRGAA